MKERKNWGRRKEDGNGWASSWTSRHRKGEKHRERMNALEGGKEEAHT